MVLLNLEMWVGCVCAVLVCPCLSQSQAFPVSHSMWLLLCCDLLLPKAVTWRGPAVSSTITPLQSHSIQCCCCADAATAARTTAAWLYYCCWCAAALVWLLDLAWLGSGGGGDDYDDDQRQWQWHHRFVRFLPNLDLQAQLSLTFRLTRTTRNWTPTKIISKK